MKSNNIFDVELYQNDLKKGLSSIDLNILRNKSVLVIGASGLIGSSVVDLLLYHNLYIENNIRIFAASRNALKLKEKYNKFSCINYVKFDALDDLPITGVYDYIIYCAGIASPELYTTQPVEVILSNFKGMHKVLDYAKKYNNTKRILYVSSSEIYGKPESNILNWVEEINGNVAINNIRSSYPITKQATELLCKAYGEEYNIDVVWVRPGHVYGPTASNKDKRVVSEFAYLASIGKNLYLKSSGLQKRSYCYCIDCGLAILFVLLKGKSNEVYNIGNDTPIDIKTMASIVAEAGNVALNYTEPTKEEIIAFNPMLNSVLNVDKLKLLGYRDIFTPEQGLTHTVKILKSISK